MAIRAGRMTGNACEWCADWYGDYSADAHRDPTGPVGGAQNPTCHSRYQREHALIFASGIVLVGALSLRRARLA